jgi:phage portal protein BeeE
MIFRRSRPDLEQYVRADVSLVSEVIGYVAAARVDGLPVAVDDLPITVGASTLHADTVAAMPARTRSTETTRRVRDLLERPDPSTDYRAFIHAGTLAMFWHGYATLLLDRPAPLTVSAEVVDPLRVSWTRQTGWSIDGISIRDELILAVPLMNDPRRTSIGESPLDRCDQALSMYGHAYRYLIDYFAQGGNPSSILKSTHALGNAPLASGKTRAQEIVSEWITARQERRPAVMDPTISLEIPNSSGELAATLSVLDYCSAEVARLLNMPGSLVNAPSNGSLTYQNVADEMRRWIALSLKPTWMARWESALRTLTGDPTIYLDPTELLDAYALLDPAIETPVSVPTPQEPR